MAPRIWNFSPGPAALPRTVLDEAARGVVEIGGRGASVLEISHRSDWFDDVIREAEEGIRRLLGVPDDYRVLFCQGGASMQFAMAPMNLLRGSGRRAEYVVTGSWGAKAFEEARRIGDARIAWDGGEEGYVRVPSADELAEVSAFGDSAYLHVTTNETIQGVEWPADPAVEAGTTLVADMSSDFLSRPIDVERYGVAYAGAQKNAGPAGVTIVLVRDELLAGTPGDVPHMLDYRTYAESGSLYNTPPVFAVYVVMLVTRWLRDEIGGLEKMAEINTEKASLLYEAIDASNGFYRGHAHPGSRSRMNVTWRLANDDLEREFLTQAAERGLMELRGHRSVGGIRASIYNAMPLEGIEALRELMDDFRARA